MLLEQVLIAAEFLAGYDNIEEGFRAGYDADSAAGGIGRFDDERAAQMRQIRDGKANFFAFGKRGNDDGEGHVKSGREEFEVHRGLVCGLDGACIGIDNVSALSENQLAKLFEPGVDIEASIQK